MIRRLQTNRFIVHHSLSGDVCVSTIDRWHMERGFDEVGYHEVIRKNGCSEHGRDISLVGAHAWGRNRDSIGVCLTGNFYKYEPEVEQLAALAEYYHASCRFAGKRLRIEFHKWIWLPALGIRSLQACPGPKLDRKDLLEIVYRRCPYEQA